MVPAFFNDTTSRQSPLIIKARWYEFGTPIHWYSSMNDSINEKLNLEIKTHLSLIIIYQNLIYSFYTQN